MALSNFPKARPPVASVLPVHDVRDDDLFIVSYPRSGNTWIRFLLANLLASGEEITFRNIEEYVPDLHKSASTLAERQGRRFVKSHHPCYEAYPRFIYIYRDGRDALVSHYHYTTERKVFAGSFGEFVVSSLASKFGSWREHVIGALDFAHSQPERVLLLQYEQMLERPRDFAAKVAAFARIETDETQLASAVAKSSFVQLQSIEKKFGAEKLEQPCSFFRKGESGQWRSYFTDELYQRYLRENGETLSRLGYSI